MKKIVKGNDFTLRIPVMKMVEGQPQAFPLPACTIEVYAKDCYNVTATHQAEVNKLTTIEEVEAYDYKTGYPEKLNLKV